MKTPYDTLARLRRRELNERRVQLAAAEDSAQTARLRVEALAQQAVAEMAPADTLPLVDFGAFRRRIIASARDAVSECRSAEDRLEEARRLGIEAFVAKKAVDLAAEGFVEQHALKSARAEQARLDEIAARTRRR